MNNQQKLEYIKQLCIKANDSILDLVFGCKVRHKKRGIAKVIDSTHLSFENEIEVVYTPFIDGNAEILGRDIQLADVLLAIGKEGVLKVNNIGGFSWFIDNGWKDIAMPRWNLLLPLHLQEESVIDFLYGILIDKEN